jgi:hypothetical protein
VLAVFHEHPTMRHRTRIARALFITTFAPIALVAVSARAQSASEPTAHATIAADSEMVAPPPRGGPGGAFGIGTGARVMVAPRPIRPVTATAPPRPRPHPRPPTDPLPPPPPAPPARMRILATLTRVEGPLARPAAQRTMPQIEARAAMCFQRAMSANPSVQGLMVIRFGIGADGSVTSTEEAANYVRDSTLSQCLATNMTSVRFPRFAGPTSALAMVQIRFVQR